jgi:3-hydroxybutyryl-CoA dehydrogenase
VLARHYEVVPWRSGAPVPNDALAVDAHVADRELKASVLLELDAALPAHSTLLTCCHASSATALSRGLSHPERVVGFALLPPVEARTTVECAAGYHTSPSAAARAESFWNACGLEALWVGDAAGLVTPRIVACLANEAAFTVMERTASPEDVDRAMELGTGYPRGPLTWAEMVGLEHIVAIMDGLAREHGEDRYRACPLLRRLAVGGAEGWSRGASAAAQPQSRGYEVDT